MPTKAKLLLSGGAIIIVVAGAVFLGFSTGFPQPPRALSGLLFVVGGLLFIEGMLRRPHLLFNVDEDVSITAEKLRMLIDSAQRRIFVITGAFNHVVYGPLEGLLSHKLDSHVDVAIVSGEGLSPESRSLVTRLSSKHKNFRFYLYPGNPVPHGVLVDDQRLRVEKPHQPGATLRSNVYVTKPSVGASLFMRRFNRYRADGDLFEPTMNGPVRVASSTVTVTETTVTSSVKEAEARDQ